MTEHELFEAYGTPHNAPPVTDPTRRRCPCQGGPVVAALPRVAAALPRVAAPPGPEEVRARVLAMLRDEEAATARDEAFREERAVRAAEEVR
jgi:hypothetical protein